MSSVRIQPIDACEQMLDNEWPYLLSLLPPDLDESAFEKGALLRKRAIESASDLLRIAMSYGFCGQSLRDTAAWAAEAKIAELSDVAVLKRLKNCADWLGYLVARVLAERAAFHAEGMGKLRLRITDASVVCRPGSRGTDFRVHLGFDLGLLQIDRIDLTDNKGGETLTRLPIEEGDVILCDRVYATRNGIHAAVSAKGHVIVRLNWQNLPLQDPEGQPFDILEHLRKLGPTQAGDFAVATVQKDSIPSIPGRVVAIRKSPQAAEASRRKLLQQAKKKGKTPDARTLESCDCIFLFTTLPAELLTARDALELYRFRWQIELSFKRMKTILQLDEMAAKDEQLCRTFLLAKLLGALLVEELCRTCDAFSPWGYGRPAPDILVAPVPSHRRRRASCHPSRPAAR